MMGIAFRRFPLHLSQALVPLLKRSTAGRIVNISSGMGQLSDMKGGYALNSDAKCNTPAL